MTDPTRAASDGAADAARRPSRTRKIAYVCSRYPALREVFIIREVLSLERAGVEVEVYSLKRPEAGLQHSVLGETRAVPYYSPHLLSAALVLDNLATLLGSPLAYLRFPLALAWRLRGHAGLALKTVALFPKMVHYSRRMKRRGISGANSCWATLPTTLAMAGEALFDIPYCMTCRAWDIFMPMNQVGLDDKVSRARLVRTNNDAGARFMRDFCRTPEDERKITRVYNPFDVAGLEPRVAAPTGRFRITSGGSLIEKKGLTFLVDAVAALRDSGRPCDLQIVGDGPLREALQRQVARLGLDGCVEFAGTVPNQVFLEEMKRSNVFVLPSVPGTDGSMDGIPNVLIESLAVGVPAVSTAISGIPELIVDGVSGLLVPPGDANALAEALGRLMADAELQRALARAGRRRVEELFEMGRNGEALAAAYSTAGLMSPGQRSSEP